MKRIPTTEEIIRRAEMVHGQRYDYSKFMYIKAKQKSCIICPEHGEFWMTPDNHLRGRGCKLCAGFLVYDTESFVQQSVIKHGGFYSYSNSLYNGSQRKLIVDCPVHGGFNITPSNHLRGKGCPACGRLRNEAGKKSFYKSQRPDLSHIETPPGSKAVPVGTKGDYALVDEEDYERVMKYNWSFSKSYAASGEVGLMHRFIMSPPDDMVIDHINHNPLDNRRCNIRICTQQENTWNLKKMSNTTSKYMGVYWSSKQNKWVTQFKHKGEPITVGSFRTEHEAAEAYNESIIQYRGEFANLNIITK